MKKTIFFLITLIFVTGCETKVTGILHQSEDQIKILQHTKRAQIINALDTVALINVTYLNPTLKDTNKEKDKYDIFIVGVYNNNDLKGYEKGGIHNPNYLLTMNNSNYEKAKKADVKKMQLSTYPFYNAWMKYYVVYFPKSDKSNLTIAYKNKTLGETKLTFNQK